MIKAHALRSDSYRDEECWDLKLNARLSHSSEGHGLPVCLLCLLPHHHIEAGGILVAEDKACVVVVGHCIHVEGALKVHTTECCVSCLWWQDCHILARFSFKTKYQSSCFNRDLN